jgi:hypothetical protein
VGKASTCSTLVEMSAPFCALKGLSRKSQMKLARCESAAVIPSGTRKRGSAEKISFLLKILNSLRSAERLSWVVIWRRGRKLSVGTKASLVRL